MNTHVYRMYTTEKILEITLLTLWSQLALQGGIIVQHNYSLIQS